MAAGCALVYARRGLDNPDEARHQLLFALRWTVGRGSFPVLTQALPAAAFLLLDQGETERAVEVYVLACSLPAVANSRWNQDVVGRPIASAAAALPPEVAEAARERGRARDIQATLKELIEELREEV